MFEVYLYLLLTGPFVIYFPLAFCSRHLTFELLFSLIPPNSMHFQAFAYFVFAGQHFLECFSSFIQLFRKTVYSNFLKRFKCVEFKTVVRETVSHGIVNTPFSSFSFSLPHFDFKMSINY